MKKFQVLSNNYKKKYCDCQWITYTTLYCPVCKTGRRNNNWNSFVLGRTFLLLLFFRKFFYYICLRLWFIYTFSLQFFCIFFKQLQIKEIKLNKLVKDQHFYMAWQTRHHTRPHHITYLTPTLTLHDALNIVQTQNATTYKIPKKKLSLKNRK